MSDVKSAEQVNPLQKLLDEFESIARHVAVHGDHGTNGLTLAAKRNAILNYDWCLKAAVREAAHSDPDCTVIPPLASKEQVDPAYLWQWLLDLANQAGPFDSRMLKAAADIVGAAKLAGVCYWTRLPDIANPLETHRVQYEAGCNKQIARGVQPIYPDNCPNCHGRVVVTGSPVETKARPFPCYHSHEHWIVKDGWWTCRLCGPGSEIDAPFQPSKGEQAEADAPKLGSTGEGRLPRPAVNGPPAHPDPTGKTREPPHCPTCGCGLSDTRGARP